MTNSLYGLLKLVVSVAAVMFVTLASSTSHAQVHRCKGADGKTVYSDAPCASSNSGGVVRLHDNVIETQMDRERNERYLLEHRRQSTETGSPAVTAPAARVGNSSAAANSPECRLAIRNANTQSGSATPTKIDNDRAEASRVCGYNPWPGKSASEVDAENRRSAAIERSLRHRARLVGQCDAGGCWDTLGVRYNGSGARLIRSDGQACRRVANSLECD
ncbi:DUF4124 domain-containing protein [Ottowia thiooxydans]|uniref:DUF4124 domain-containing protein n=1 Tax=Ottowia thiooxydans TaxID=219182 RepID=A0ABV2QI68_9BURK